jgi:hypothetical protein
MDAFIYSFDTVKFVHTIIPKRSMFLATHFTTLTAVYVDFSVALTSIK